MIIAGSSPGRRATAVREMLSITEGLIELHRKAKDGQPITLGLLRSILEGAFNERHWNKGKGRWVQPADAEGQIEPLEDHFKSIICTEVSLGETKAVGWGNKVS